MKRFLDSSQALKVYILIARCIFKSHGSAIRWHRTVTRLWPP